MKHTSSLWFFINSTDRIIYTYGSGDRPSATYRFDCEKAFRAKIRQLKADGYDLIKDQRPR